MNRTKNIQRNASKYREKSKDQQIRGFTTKYKQLSKKYHDLLNEMKNYKKIAKFMDKSIENDPKRNLRKEIVMNLINNDSKKSKVIDILKL